MPSELLHTTSLDDAPAYWFLNNLHILLTKSESTGGAYSLIHLTASPGFETPYHLHHTEDEAFYVLDGEFTFICDGRRRYWGRADTSFFHAECPTVCDAAAKRTLTSLYTSFQVRKLGLWE